MVKYIHGKIDSKPNNMVMGMNVYEPNFDRRLVYFMKFFQRIQKRTDILTADEINNISLSKILEVMNNSNTLKPELGAVCFYGHSMSHADGDIIRLLREPVKGKGNLSFVIFYYNQIDYENKVINLFVVFGKDETIKMIHDKEITFLPTSEIAL